MSSPTRDGTTAGIRAGFVAYTIWGLLTVYWKQLTDFAPLELIGWRVLTAAVVMTAVVSLRHSWAQVVAALRTRRVAGRIAVAALLLSCNWLAYVYAIVNDRVIETALGYFIAPLGTMGVGILVFGERPSRSQRAAMVLAAAAVVVVTISYGRVPVAALVIAVTWSTYVYHKRHIPLTGVDGFAAESFVLLVPAAIVVAGFAVRADGIVSTASGGELALVPLSGLATSVPLVLFAFAAVRVPFTVLGPLNYLVPTINFLLGWGVYGEPLPWSRVAGFALVWAALVLVTTDQLRRAGSRQAAATPPTATVGSPAS